jgi:hypothetical protein
MCFPTKGFPGHAIIYNGSGCVGGTGHCYFDADSGVQSVNLLKLK